MEDNTNVVRLVTTKKYDEISRPILELIGRGDGTVTPAETNQLIDDLLKLSQKLGLNLDEMTEIPEIPLPPDHMLVVITEKQDNVYQLSKYLIDNLKTMDSTTIKGFLIQIISVLEELKSLKIRHHDLHLGNILISKGENLEKLYAIGSRTYKVDLSKGRILMFDWDFASAEQFCGKNIFVSSYCDYIGTCDDDYGSNKYDLVKVFFAFYNNITKLYTYFTAKAVNSKTVEDKQISDHIAELLEEYMLLMVPHVKKKLTLDDLAGKCHKDEENNRDDDPDCGYLRSRNTKRFFKSKLPEDFPQNINLYEIMNHKYFDDLRI
jgi:serine/threonine protein kinase